MSNVTSLASRQRLKLERLEAEIVKQLDKQESATEAMGRSLLEIHESGEYKPMGSFNAYLEDFSNRLLDQGKMLDPRNMWSYFKAAEFDKRILNQPLRKREREAIHAASPEAKRRFSGLVRETIKDAPTPINESQAIKQLFDAGYFDPTDRQPITADKVRAVTTARSRDDNPGVLAFQLKAKLDAAIEIMDGYTNLGDATEDPDLRHAARTTVRLLKKHFNL